MRRKILMMLTLLFIVSSSLGNLNGQELGPSEPPQLGDVDDQGCVFTLVAILWQPFPAVFLPIPVPVYSWECPPPE